MLMRPRADMSFGRFFCWSKDKNHNNVGFNTMKIFVIDGKYLMFNSMVFYLIYFNGIYLLGGNI